MMRYQLLSLDKTGSVLSSRVADCMTDREAITAAERWYGSMARIEVWNDSRPVCLCFKRDEMDLLLSRRIPASQPAET